MSCISEARFSRFADQREMSRSNGGISGSTRGGFERRRLWDFLCRESCRAEATEVWAALAVVGLPERKIESGLRVAEYANQLLRIVEQGALERNGNGRIGPQEIHVGLTW